MSQLKITSYLYRGAKTSLIIFLVCFSFLQAEDIAKIGKRIINSKEIDSLATLIITAQGANANEISSQQKEQLNRGILENLIAEELVRLEVKVKKMKVSSKTLDSAFKSFQEQFGGSSKFESVLKSSGQNLSEFKNKLKQELLSQQLLKKFLSEIQPPSELEIKKYFTANKKKFPVNDSLRASQIFLVLAKKPSTKEIQEKTKTLNDIYKRITAISRVEERLIVFSKIAVKTSEGLYAEQGGDMGFFQKGDFVSEFNKNVKSLETGELSKVFRTPQGLHLVLLTTKNNGQYESYRLSIIQAIIEEQSHQNQTKLGEYIQKLAKEYKVEILSSKYAAPNSSSNTKSLPFK